MLLCLKLLFCGSLIFAPVAPSSFRSFDHSIFNTSYQPLPHFKREHFEYLPTIYSAETELKSPDYTSIINKYAHQYNNIMKQRDNASHSEYNVKNEYHLDNSRMNFKNVAPVHYDLDIMMLDHKNLTSIVNGTSTITLNVYKQTEDLAFHYFELFNTKVKLFGKNGEIVINGRMYLYSKQALKLFFDPMLQPGIYILQIAFNARLSDTSVETIPFLGSNKAPTSVLMTYLQPFASRFFPCLDDPAFKSTVNITLTHNFRDQVLSNMPRMYETRWKNGISQSKFYETPAIPVNRVALVVASSHYLSEKEKNYTIWFRFWARREVRSIIDTGDAEIISIIEKLTAQFQEDSIHNLPYHISHVIVPYTEKRYGYYGVCVYTESEVFYQRRYDAFAHKIEMIYTIGNALADQWFTNVIPPYWWTDLWLNKGITRFIALDFLHKVYPELRMKDLFVVQTLHESLHLDTEDIMKPLFNNLTKWRELESLFSFPFYMKAPAIIRMVKHILPHETFNMCIKAMVYYQWPKFVTAHNFWNYLQYSLTNVNLTINLPNNKKTHLDQVMESWIKLQHYPLVHVERNYETGEVKLRQQHFQGKDVNSTGTWWIPITIVTRTDANFDNTKPLIWLNSSNQHDTINFIDEKDWIMLNPQQSGYYRVNYDTHNWMLIANYLNSSNYTKIHILNRVQLIDDAYHLLVTNNLEYKVFLELTEYLSQETDYVAWYPMFKSFEYLSTYLPYEEAAFLKAHMLKLLDGLLANITFTERPNDDEFTKMLRHEAAKWACTLGHSQCLKAARMKLEEYLERTWNDYFFASQNLIYGWTNWMYRKGAMTVDMDTWNKNINHLERKLIQNAGALEVFEVLSCSENPAIINYTVNDMFIKLYEKQTIYTKLVYQKPLKVICSIYAKHARNMLQDMLEHLKGHSEKLVTKMLAVTVYHLYSIDHLEMVNKFAQSNLKDENTIVNIQFLLETRLSQIQNHMAKFRKWFKLAEVKIKKRFLQKAIINKYETTEKKFKPIAKSYTFLLENVLPLHYDIKLIMPKRIEELNFTFGGECSVRIVIQRATQEIGLHSLEQKIYNASLIRVKYFSSDNLHYKQIYYCTKFSHDLNNEIVILKFGVSLLPGNYILNVQFESSLNGNGVNGNGVSKSLYQNGNGNGNGNRMWLFATPSQPIRARQVFPCWDEPSLKSTFNISVNHDPNYIPISNMPIEKVRVVNGTVWTYFDITPTMSTHHMAMVVMVKDLYRISNIEKNINMWSRMLVVPYISFAYTVAEMVMKDLTQHTGMKIPKTDHLVIPEIQEDIIGNWGLNIYKEAVIMYDEELDTVAQKMNVARLLARAVAQQLFNNVTNPSWLFYPWLSEGLSMFLGTYAIEKNLICPRAMELFVVQVQHESLHLDTNYNMQSLIVEHATDLQSFFSYPFYVKAPAIVRMLQHITTNILFVQSDIFTTFRIKALTPYDICYAMEAALKKLSIKNGDYTLKDVMTTWTTQNNYPIVNVTRTYSNGHVTIMQQISSSDQKKWWIPITYATQAKPYFSNILFIRWLEPRLENVTINGIDNRGWIIVNLQQIGYYRVNYDRKNWILISDYLNSDRYKKIHVLNRAQIIDDAYHLMMVNQLDHKIFLDIIEYLSQETDYIAWYPMFKILEYLSNFLPFPESEPLQFHVLKIFRGLLARIGYDEYPKENDFIKCLRQEAAKWACILGDNACKLIAQHKLEKYLENPVIATKLLPGWKHWTYCAGLKTAKSRIWHKMWDKLYTNTSDNMALSLLSCSDSFTISRDILELMLSGNIMIQDNTRIDITYSIIAKHARNNLESILKLLEKHHTLDISKTLSIIINHLYSENHLDKVNKFIRNYTVNEETIADIGYSIKLRLVYITSYVGKFSSIFSKT